MTANVGLIRDLRDRAFKLGVVLAMPRHTLWVDAQSQNQIFYAAAREIHFMEREQNG